MNSPIHLSSVLAATCFHLSAVVAYSKLQACVSMERQYGVLCHSAMLKWAPVQLRASELHRTLPHILWCTWLKRFYTVNMYIMLASMHWSHMEDFGVCVLIR